MCDDRGRDVQTTIVNSLFNLFLPHPGHPKLSQPSTTMTYPLSSNSSQVRLDHRRLSHASRVLIAGITTPGIASKLDRRQTAFFSLLYQII